MEAETKSIVFNYKPSKAKTQRQPRTVPSIEDTIAKQLASHPIRLKKTPLVKASSQSGGTGTNEFNDSMQFMQNIALKQHYKQAAALASPTPTPTSTPTLAPAHPKKSAYPLDREIPYGCLKGGKKTTFKVWNQTRKQFEERVFETPSKEGGDGGKEDFSVLAPVRPPTPPLESKLNVMREYDLTNDTTPYVPQKKERRYSRSAAVEDAVVLDEGPKMQVTVGKSCKGRKVAVLLGNSATRKNIQTLQKTIKKSSVHDARRYLCERGLIKVGSAAPNEVIRSMYESVQLTGDVRNSNPDTLLHNFMADGTKGSLQNDIK